MPMVNGTTECVFMLFGCDLLQTYGGTYQLRRSINSVQENLFNKYAAQIKGLTSARWVIPRDTYVVSSSDAFSPCNWSNPSNACKFGAKTIAKFLGPIKLMSEKWETATQRSSNQKFERF